MKARDLAALAALGIAGKVYAGSFAILPEKISGETARRRYAETLAAIKFGSRES